MNYENLVLAKLGAKKDRAQDAILLDDQGFIAEATTSNIFIVKNDQLFTPSADSPILLGVTRQVIIENFKVIERNISVKELLAADEVFLTGTTDFITRVKSINGKKIKNFEYSEKIFQKLIQLTK